VLLRTDRTAEAEAYLRKAAAVDPGAYDVNSGLGMLAQVRGDRALAEREYYEELRLHPDNRSARLGLAALKAQR
jgi:Flp pilus assembly protein TadD